VNLVIPSISEFRDKIKSSCERRKSRAAVAERGWCKSASLSERSVQWTPREALDPLRLTTKWADPPRDCASSSKGGSVARKKDLEIEIQQQMIGMIAQIVLFNHAANASLGLGASDSQFLTLLRTRGPLTPGQLAEATKLTSGTVTGVIDRLEKAKLVRRERDSDDRRKVLVVPVADAVDRLAPIYAGQGELLHRVLARRTAAELEVISNFLSDLVAQERTA
jgi:DNA-binding MarR family transcriptional regulator